MWTDSVFSHLETALDSRDREVRLYDADFFDPDKIAELTRRYTTKSGVLLDIENVEVVSFDSGVKLPRINAVVVAYCIHPNQRDVNDKVRGSAGLAQTVAGLVNGTSLTGSEEHSAGVFKFVQMLRENDIPFISVHSVRWSIELTVIL